MMDSGLAGIVHFQSNSVLLVSVTLDITYYVDN